MENQKKCQAIVLVSGTNRTALNDSGITAFNFFTLSAVLFGK